jgi:membrane protein YdbS with pleckstrin-like domain
VVQIVCDACEKTFEVDDAEAGGKMPCPHCGDINRIPERGRADAAELPTGDGTEQEVCVVRPGMFRAHPFRYLLIVLLIVGGLTLAILAKMEKGVWPWTMWPALVLAAAALVWFAGWWLSTHYWVKLVVSNKRTVRHEGIVRRHTTEVLHNHVRSVDIRQNFLQRILGVGALGIDSAGQDGIEIEVRDIPRPYEIKKVIDQYRRM